MTLREQRDDDSSVRSNSVSTRKLIIASLVCGLLILMAGTVKLLQTAADTEPTVKLLAPGQTAEIGAVAITVRDVRVTNEQTLVDVLMSGVDVDEAAIGWSMLANGEITASVEVPQCEQNAKGAAGGATSEADQLACTLVFVAARGTPTIVYSRDGEKRQWLGS